METGSKWHSIFEGWKKRTVNQEPLIQWKGPSENEVKIFLGEGKLREFVRLYTIIILAIKKL